MSDGYYDQSYPPSLWAPPPPEPEPAPPPPEPELPEGVAAFTITEVEAWVDANPEQAQAVYDAEAARGGDARSTLLTWLLAHGAEEPAP